jgi:zinc/manganese transport system permease protein
MDAILGMLSIMWLPFLACLVMVTILAYLGIHILTRGVIFVDLALAQIAALGATVAVLLGHELDSGWAYGLGLAFTLVGAAVFAFSRVRYEGVPQEAIIGVTWAVASSAAILTVSKAPHGAEDIQSLLVGSILWVRAADVARAAAVYGVVGLFHWFFRKRFFRISLDPEGAMREGVRVRLWDFLFYAVFGLVVTTSVKMAGVLLVFSFLIVPSIVGVLFGRDIRGRLIVGWIVGWIVSILGCIASYRADLAPGATIVCTFGVVLLLALTIRRMRSLEAPWSPGAVVGAAPDASHSARAHVPAASSARAEQARRE